ncbi:hypothetical protein MPTK1_2g05490 [Marchantia polymorpha subsp. ruderalis]|uniref:Uncharacterized protein n=1 Tax=Marchantia polymorpha TaxID=3197 RepID=A0A2R6XDE8_MARPO|nr:hypothetical protein MARPO_0021s0006 [Marchantia polymorpha]BBN01200.1 hypothetical protein Mp_2g05490 [Marchantia polymorpha subsp. ruderalis]|eukprot:PTQ44123.1 hypothetical protein MARPO_0021s0006 [Marchantia polymorpha]
MAEATGPFHQNTSSVARNPIELSMHLPRHAIGVGIGKVFSASEDADEAILVHSLLRRSVGQKESRGELRNRNRWRSSSSGPFGSSYRSQTPLRNRLSSSSLQSGEFRPPSKSKAVYTAASERGVVVVQSSGPSARFSR